MGTVFKIMKLLCFERTVKHNEFLDILHVSQKNSQDDCIQYNRKRSHIENHAINFQSKLLSRRVNSSNNNISINHCVYTQIECTVQIEQASDLVRICQIC